jgi:dolichol-phosphate mannosyltransferase
MIYSIVLPALNEAENLRELLPRIHRAMAASDGHYEILVVGIRHPADATEQVCGECGAAFIPREPGPGFGDAFRTGIRRARGDWIVFMDADGSHPPEFLPKLIAETGAADLIVASRYIEGGTNANGLMLVGMSRALNGVFSRLLGLGVQDVSNNFKAYRAAVLKELPLQCRSFDVIEEAFFLAKKTFPGLRVVEIPFSFERRRHGKSKRKLASLLCHFLATAVRLRFLR